jgi:hypothetical protein
VSSWARLTPVVVIIIIFNKIASLYIIGSRCTRKEGRIASLSGRYPLVLTNWGIPAEALPFVGVHPGWAGR